jgi:hypothetical protein
MSGSLFKSLQGFKEDAPIASIEGRSKPEARVAPSPINILVCDLAQIAESCIVDRGMSVQLRQSQKRDLWCKSEHTTIMGGDEG